MPALDPEAVQRRLFAAVRAIVKADGERDKPALVFFEDLHWIDATSEAFLAQVIEATSTARGLNLLNFRPGYRADWMNGPTYQQLPLVPLGPGAIAELLDDLLGRDESVADLPTLVSDRAAGNPFFIEEIVQSLVETGALEGVRGAYRLVRPATALAVPATVQALLAARIDRLPESAKALLQQASVIGKTFEERVLRRISALANEEFDSALRTLREAEFLFEASLYPHAEYAFKHPLTQEVADQSQLAISKTAAHAAVARVIEELSADRLDEESALLAHHWEQAGDAAAAARWHARAARWIGYNDYNQSYEHWQRAAELTEGIDCDSELTALRTAAFQRLLTLSFRCPSSPEQERALFQRARAHLEQYASDDHAALAVLTASFSALRQNAGAIDEYLEYASEASRIADRSGSAAARAAVRVEHFYALFCKGRLAESLAVADEMMSIVGDDVDLGADLHGYSPYVMNFALTPWPLMHAGRIGEAERRARHAVATTSRHGPDETESWAHGILIEVLSAKGEGAGAANTARLALAAAERSGSPQALMGALTWSGLAHVLTGDFAGAIAQTLAAERCWSRSGAFSDLRSWTHLVMAKARLGAGDPHGAIEAAREARRIADEQGQPLPAVRASILEAQGLIALNGAANADEIEKLLDDAAAGVKIMGADAATPHIEETRGLLARAAGDEAGARERFESARRLYEQHGASGHAVRVRGLIQR
jgi:adenylate cyclase